MGDIDAIRQNATLKRLAMQVEFVAEVEDRYPRVITRRVYQPTLVFRPNCPTLWLRYECIMPMAHLGEGPVCPASLILGKNPLTRGLDLPLNAVIYMA